MSADINSDERLNFNRAAVKLNCSRLHCQCPHRQRANDDQNPPQTIEKLIR